MGSFNKTGVRAACFHDSCSAHVCSAKCYWWLNHCNSVLLILHWQQSADVDVDVDVRWLQSVGKLQ